MLNRIFQLILDRLVFPLFVFILTPIVAIIGSEVSTGEWLGWISKVPTLAYFIVTLVMVLWLSVILVRKRLNYLREQDAGIGIAIVSNPIFGWIELDEIRYKEVIWRTRTPAPGIGGSFDPKELSPDAIQVQTPPRCPECQTEIEESHSFWGGYLWRCVQCGFMKRNRDSFYREFRRAERIAQRKWEEYQKNFP